MANAANSPFVKHPALLALFAPRPPPPFKPPMPTKPMGKLSGIASFTLEFNKDSNDPPPSKFETPTERKIRLKKEKHESHLKILSSREQTWDPHNNPKATKDPYKTLFVARLSYELTEDDLRREFERYGRIREVKLITDKNSGKSRGYAFIEFERSNDLKEAFQHADGHKLKGRRILVDVERGRTVKTWKPRKLGGGLGKTRAGPKDDNNRRHGSGSGGNRGHGSGRSNHGHKSGRDRMHSSRSKKDGKYSSRRDKYRDRDFRDRDRKSSRTDRDRKDTERSSRNDRDRTRDKKRSRSRDRNKDNTRDRSKRDRDRIKKEDNNRDRNRMDMKDRNRNDRSRNDRNNKLDRDRLNGRKDRDTGNDRDRTSSRRRRSRSKDKNRDRRR